jgi:hypothetical protein
MKLTYGTAVEAFSGEIRENGIGLCRGQKIKLLGMQYSRSVFAIYKMQLPPWCGCSRRMP